jgi:hypothetical protein
MRDFLSQDDINNLKNFLTHKEQKLFFETMSTLHGSIIGLEKVQSLRDETNPNAQTYIIDAEPESVDITLEVTNRNKDVTELLITQNNDRFSSERTVSFPTDKLTDVETIRSLRDVVKNQYKSDAMRTILQDSLLFHHTESSVEETKDARGKTEFTYTFWGYGSDPVRFVMNETFMDLPPIGGSLQYKEFDTFNKEWKTQASYLSEALMSTKNHVSGNDTIVGIPEIYGDKWSIDNFVTKQTLRKTLEQNLIMAPLHQITNDTKLLDTINQDYNIAYKIPDPNENRICDVDLYIYHSGQEITEPNEHTKRFIMRYQHPTNNTEFGYFTAYDPTGPEPKLIARVPHTSDSIADMIELTNHLKDLSGPAIEKQVTQKKQLSRFSLNHNVAHEENEDLEP